MIYLKFMPWQSLITNSRNKREMSVAHAEGYQITVISSDGPQLAGYEDYTLLSDDATPLGYNIPRLRRYAIILGDYLHLAKKLRRLPKDVVSCHDLTALLIGYLSTLGLPSAKKPKLIYDSHEFELGRNAKRSKLQLWWIKRLEGFLIRRCAFSIMVNDAIADEVQHIYNLKQRSIVVRSTPENWVLNGDTAAAVRKEFCDALHVSTDAFLVMYHGAVVAGRGIESLIEEVAQNDRICGVVLGNSQSPTYLQALQALVQDKGIEGRVLFHPAVPIEQLRNYVGAADVGLVTIPATCESYYYMLPNKFFENIQSLTPVICSQFPAIGELVSHYQIGLSCDPQSADDIHVCVERMRTDKEFYAQCKKNLEAAKADLCWEKEKEVLKEAYRTYL